MSPIVISLSLYLFPLACLADCNLQNLTDDRVSNLGTCSLFSLTKRSKWLPAKLLLCSCCLNGVHKSTANRICGSYTDDNFLHVHCPREMRQQSPITKIISLLITVSANLFHVTSRSEITISSIFFSPEQLRMDVWFILILCAKSENPFFECQKRASKIVIWKTRSWK